MVMFDGAILPPSPPLLWQERQSFYLFGLVGESHIDAQGVCQGRNVSQMQTQQSFVDGLLGLVTIGIYAPHTAKVWCE